MTTTRRIVSILSGVGVLGLVAVSGWSSLSPQLMTLGSPSTTLPLGEVRSAPLAGELVWVPGGTFEMGSPDDEASRGKSEGPVHQVRLEGLWVMKAEVSQALYELVAGLQPSGFGGCPTCPVEQVSWFEAVQFANELSEAEGLTPPYVVTGVAVQWQREADGYRLLTEAEWEYAARGGQPFLYSGADDATVVGWTHATSNDETHPSCLKPMNGFGLCDMTGNVREWVWDRHGPYPSADQVNPSGPPEGVLRVLRGGSWHSPASRARVAFRFSNLPDYKSLSLGVRLARPAWQ